MNNLLSAILYIDTAIYDKYYGFDISPSFVAHNIGGLEFWFNPQTLKNSPRLIASLRKLVTAGYLTVSRDCVNHIRLTERGLAIARRFRRDIDQGMTDRAGYAYWFKRPYTHVRFAGYPARYTSEVDQAYAKYDKAQGERR